MYGTSVVNFQHISHYSTVIIDEFEQINTGWAWETIVWDNKFFFGNCEKYVFILIHPT